MLLLCYDSLWSRISENFIQFMNKERRPKNYWWITNILDWMETTKTKQKNIEYFMAVQVWMLITTLLDEIIYFWTMNFIMLKHKYGLFGFGEKPKREIVSQMAKSNFLYFFFFFSFWKFNFSSFFAQISRCNLKNEKEENEITNFRFTKLHIKKKKKRKKFMFKKISSKFEFLYETKFNENE